MALQSSCLATALRWPVQKLGATAHRGERLLVPARLGRVSNAPMGALLRFQSAMRAAAPLGRCLEWVAQCGVQPDLRKVVAHERVEAFDLGRRERLHSRERLEG